MERKSGMSRPTAGQASVSGVGPTAAELSPERKLQLLMQISRQGYDTLDLDRLLNHLLDTAATVVAYDAAGIFVLSRELIDSPYARPRQLIAGVARRGFDELPVETDPMLMLGEGIVGHVVRTGEPVIARDVSADRRYVPGRKRTRSEITVPIKVEERVIGALNLESDGVGSFGEGDLDVLHFFADAAAISIEKAMLHRQILEKQRLDEQLRIAQEVQSRLLPAAAPDTPGYDIAGICIPTHAIGGDAFDYVPLPDGRLGIFVADVSGKGVAAALIMFAFRALLRAQSQHQQDLARLAAEVNGHLLESTGQEDFITCLYGILDPGSGRFAYVNCGHNPPLLLEGRRSSRTLRNGNLILGVFADARYDSDEIVLAPGDRLILYTDGVVECEDDGGAAFGISGLTAVAEGAGPVSSRKLIAAIVDRARAFTGREQFEDDLTVVVVGRKRPA